MKEQRVGFGYDVHRFGGDGPVILCGVTIDHPVGVVATSDGDVGTHALVDAVLGSAAAGDIGSHFPSSDPQWEGADSVELLRQAVRLVFDRGFDIINADVTIIAESLKVAPHRDAMREALTLALRVPPASISVKATSTDGLGFIGTDEGLAAYAVVTIQR